jgi:hypothetical protein
VFLNIGMAQNTLTREPNESDRQTVRGLFYAKPIIERGRPLFQEMLWFLSGCPNPDQHEKSLPDYCYNILAVIQKTFFKNVPLLSDTVLIMDQSALPSAKTMDEVKKVLRFDWANMGKICALGMRCTRFAELEAEKGIDGDNLADSTPEQVNRIFTMIFGQAWVRQNQDRISATPPDKLLSELLNEFLVPWTAKLKELQPKLNSLAYQWSSEAMIQYQKEFAGGLTEFIDENGQLTGETERSGIYFFLLLLWPEIMAMQVEFPRNTLTNLHEWLQPFMRVGVIPDMDIEYFRDVCAPPPSGIGLSLRPLKPRPPSA